MTPTRDTLIAWVKEQEAEWRDLAQASRRMVDTWANEANKAGSRKRAVAREALADRFAALHALLVEGEAFKQDVADMVRHVKLSKDHGCRQCVGDHALSSTFICAYHRVKAVITSPPSEEK